MYTVAVQNALQERDTLGMSVVEEEQRLRQESAHPWYTPGAPETAEGGTPDGGKKGKKKKKKNKSAEATEGGEGGEKGGEGGRGERGEEEREKERREEELARRFADENPAAVIGVVPPSFASSGGAALKQMFAAAPPGSKRARRQIREMQLLLELKFRDSLVQAGEPVGVLAAQSIGEPSTQMT